MNVRQERTGWRCEAISERHRRWGWDCPAVDLDFLLLEYNRAEPVAMIEYKDRHAQPPNLNHPTYQAVARLADNYAPGAIPFFVATYCPVDWWFRVTPVNATARIALASVTDRTLTEQRFVRMLYWLRKLTLTAQDEALIQGLNSVLPPAERAA